jgi:hypothetical protein
MIYITKKQAYYFDDFVNDAANVSMRVEWSVTSLADLGL